MIPMKTPGRLILRGWKGISGEIGLWPVTFLVGPNGCGKSSILESLALLSHLARRGTLSEDLRPWLRGWPEGVFARSGTGKPVAEAFIELQWRGFFYQLKLKNPQRPIIAHERLSVGGKDYIVTTPGHHPIRKFYGRGAGRPLVTDDPYESALGLMARSPQRRERALAVIDLMTRIEVYALDADFLRGTVADPRPIPYARKGTSLVSRLLDAYKYPNVWDKVLAALKAVQPDLDTIEVSYKPRGAILKYHDGRQHELDEESDGLVRAAGMFLVRYGANCPAILGFDEPENGYHLSRLIDVVTHLAPPSRARDEGLKTVLLATHSPALVKKAVQSLKGRTGVISLWRGREGRVILNAWAGRELCSDKTFNDMVSEAFEGR